MANEKSEAFKRIVADCKRQKIKYVDDFFPAQDSSIYYSRPLPRSPEWRRPNEIVSTPKFVSGGATRFDVIRGGISNEWFAAAVQALTLNESLLYRVIGHQSFDDSNYVGAFYFNFWVEGEWKEVIIDDRLPAHGDLLYFMHSSDKDEFWCALLEKAYAKLYGSYEAMKEGTFIEAATDLTGGVSETFDLKKPPTDLFRLVLKGMKRQGIMACHIKDKTRRSDGLVPEICYTITHADKIRVRRTDDTEFIRLRSPRGSGTEWNGRWSDRSNEWRNLSVEDKKNMELTFDADGEFWMQFDDFLDKFDILEVCKMGPDSITDPLNDYDIVQEHGEWVIGATAGGNRNFPSFHSNPRYHMKLKKPDDDGVCRVVILLMQKGLRKQRRRGVKPLLIGVTIYKVEENVTGLDKRYTDYHDSIAASTFSNTRENIGRFTLEPGNYIIVPATSLPNEEGKFLLRIFTSKPYVSKIDQDVAIARPKAGTRDVSDGHLDDQFRETFRKLAGIDEEIDAKELQELLSSLFKKEMRASEFDYQICKKIMASRGNENGQLEYSHFRKLWSDIRAWRNSFMQCDRDKSGEMDPYELTNALKDIGMSLGNTMAHGLILRFSSPSGALMIDGFIHIIITIEYLNSEFLKHTSIADPLRATFDLKSFLGLCLHI